MNPVRPVWYYTYILRSETPRLYGTPRGVSHCGSRGFFTCFGETRRSIRHKSWRIPFSHFRHKSFGGPANELWLASTLQDSWRVVFLACRQAGAKAGKKNDNFYTGSTNNLRQRMAQHKKGLVSFLPNICVHLN
jgi:hypothetical protein